MKIYLDGAEMKVTAVVAVVLVIMVMTLVPEVAAEIHTVSAVKEAVLTLVEPLYAVETLFDFGESGGGDAFGSGRGGSEGDCGCV